MLAAQANNYSCVAILISTLIDKKLNIKETPKPQIRFLSKHKSVPSNPSKKTEHLLQQLLSAIAQGKADRIKSDFVLTTEFVNEGTQTYALHFNNNLNQMCQIFLTPME